MKVKTAYEGVPGLVETVGAHDETTLVVDSARIVEACLHLRDGQGFNFLSDLTPTDYLGWGSRGVSGYIGTTGGRDMHGPGTQGLARVPDPKPKRFAVNYHLLRLGADHRPSPRHRTLTIMEGKNALKWTRLSCRRFRDN